jgi:hypothetical protein
MLSFRQIYLTSYKAGSLPAFFDQKCLIQVMQSSFEQFYRNAQTVAIVYSNCCILDIRSFLDSEQQPCILRRLTRVIYHSELNHSLNNKPKDAKLFSKNYVDEFMHSFESSNLSP